jgi:hypothetical protein
MYHRTPWNTVRPGEEPAYTIPTFTAPRSQFRIPTLTNEEELRSLPPLAVFPQFPMPSQGIPRRTYTSPRPPPIGASEAELEAYFKSFEDQLR